MPPPAELQKPPEASTRYLVSFAYIPDEASWCACASLAALRKKVEALWDVTDAAFVFYLTSRTSRATAVKITCDEDFRLWYRSGDPITSRLVAHDRSKVNRVLHSSGLAQMPHRPTIDSLVVIELGASFYIRHSACDEVVLVGNDEPAVWGRAVQKVQQAWEVHRPLFRYVDDLHGERVVVSIIDAEDFRTWRTNRCPLNPEITVFEHAIPQLLEEPMQYAVSPPLSIGVKQKTQNVVESQDGQRPSEAFTPSVYVNPPVIHNHESIDNLYVAATGRPSPASKPKPTPGDVQLSYLQQLLMRRAEVEALASNS